MGCINQSIITIIRMRATLRSDKSGQKKGEAQGSANVTVQMKSQSQNNLGEFQSLNSLTQYTMQQIHHSLNISSIQMEDQINYVSLPDTDPSPESVNHLCELIYKSKNKLIQTLGRLRFATLTIRLDDFIVKYATFKYGKRPRLLQKIESIRNNESLQATQKQLQIKNTQKLLEKLERNQFERCHKLVQQILSDINKFFSGQTDTKQPEFHTFLTNLKKLCIFEQFTSFRLPKNKLTFTLMKRIPGASEIYKYQSQLRQQINDFPYLTIGQQHWELVQSLMLSKNYTKFPYDSSKKKNFIAFKQFPYLFLRESSLPQTEIQEIINLHIKNSSTFATKLKSFINPADNLNKYKQLLQLGIDNLVFISYPSLNKQIYGFTFKGKVYVNTYYCEKIKRIKEINVVYCFLVLVRVLTNFVSQKLTNYEEKIGDKINIILQGEDIGYKFELSVALPLGFQQANKEQYHILNSEEKFNFAQIAKKRTMYERQRVMIKQQSGQGYKYIREKLQHTPINFLVPKPKNQKNQKIKKNEQIVKSAGNEGANYFSNQKSMVEQKPETKQNEMIKKQKIANSFDPNCEQPHGKRGRSTKKVISRQIKGRKYNKDNQSLQDQLDDNQKQTEKKNEDKGDDKNDDDDNHDDSHDDG